MTITPDNTAATWLDIADQLTPAQIEWAAKFQRDTLGEAAEVADALLDEARQHAARNLNDQMMFGHLPAPAGAARVWHWEQSSDGTWAREFCGTKRESRTVDVAIDGAQNPDGSIRRWASIYSGESAQLSPDDLRAVAAVLIEAAEEIDELTYQAPTEGDQ